MTRVAVFTIVAPVLTGCAAAPMTQQPISAGAECIALNQVVGRRVAGPNAIEFEMVDGSVIRNDLASACPGLERLGGLATISISSGGEGGRLCRGDRVRIFDPIEARATGLQSYPECLVGGFTQVAQP